MTRLVHVVANREQDFARLENYHHDISDYADNAQLLWPRAVEVQPTARCHRVCSFCSHIIRNKSGRFFDLRKMQNLLRELLDCEISTLAISGGGEPLYWGWENIIPTLRLARQFPEVSLTSSCDQFWRTETNDLHPMTSEVLSLLDRIYVNVPAVGEEEWSNLVKKGNSWEETERMLRAIVRLREQTPQISCMYLAVVVLSQSNLDGLHEIDRTLTDIGFDGIYYKEFKNFEHRNIKRLALEKGRLMAKLDEACAAGASPSMAAFRHLISEESFGKGVPCWANRVSASAVIDPAGEVYPCTPTVGLPQYSIGNIHDMSFKDLWHTERRKALVASLDQRSINMRCPAECREHAFNRVADSAMTKRVLE